MQAVLYKDLVDTNAVYETLWFYPQRLGGSLCWPHLCSCGAVPLAAERPQVQEDTSWEVVPTGAVSRCAYNRYNAPDRGVQVSVEGVREGVEVSDGTQKEG